MKLNDVKDIVNELYLEQVQGSTMQEINELSCVDIGKKLSSLSNVNNNLYQMFIDRVGRYVQKNKIYRAKFKNLIRDAWEWGAIKQTVRVRPFNAVSDPMRSPVNGQTYTGGFTYHKADVVAKYFSTYDNFQFVWTSENYETLWTSFNSWEELNRFFDGIEMSIVSSKEKRLEALLLNCINAMTGRIIADADYHSGDLHDMGNVSTLKFVNIFKNWNDSHGASEQFSTVAEANQSKEYLKFKYLTLLNYKNRFTDLTNLLNIDGEDVFTLNEDINIVLLDTQANNMKVNLESDTFHNDLVSLDKIGAYETVSYWQGTGTSYAFDDTSKINVKVQTSDSDTTGRSVECSGIIGVMFDRNACGVNCERTKTTSQYIAEIDRYNYFDKYQAQYFNDFSENFVVFAEIAPAGE